MFKPKICINCQTIYQDLFLNRALQASQEEANQEQTVRDGNGMTLEFFYDIQLNEIKLITLKYRTIC